MRELTSVVEGGQSDTVVEVELVAGLVDTGSKMWCGVSTEAVRLVIVVERVADVVTEWRTLHWPRPLYTHTHTLSLSLSPSASVTLCSFVGPIPYLRLSPYNLSYFSRLSNSKSLLYPTQTLEGPQTYQETQLSLTNRVTFALAFCNFYNGM